MPVPVANIIQSGIGLAESAIGLINAGKTKEIAAELERNRPPYEISPTVGQDLSFAESELANANSAGTRAYNDLNNGQFSASLGAILRSGGSPNDIGSIYGNSQEGRLRLAMMQDQMRLQRIESLRRARANQQQELQTKWQVDKFAPWADKSRANAEARERAQGQIWDGINAFGGGAMNAANTIQEQDALSLPTGITGGNGDGFNNYRATGVPTNYSSPSYPQAGNTVGYNQPKYNGWMGVPYNQ